jgi:hypothetical protein
MTTKTIRSQDIMMYQYGLNKFVEECIDEYHKASERTLTQAQSFGKELNKLLEDHYTDDMTLFEARMLFYGFWSGWDANKR